MLFKEHLATCVAFPWRYFAVQLQFAGVSITWCKVHESDFSLNLLPRNSELSHFEDDVGPKLDGFSLEVNWSLVPVCHVN